MRRDCRALWLVVVLAAGCGAAPRPVQVAASCQSSHGFTVEVEAGIADSCADLLRNVEWFQAIHAERWPAVSLQGWTVRVLKDAPVDGHLGHTWTEDRVLDIADGALVVLPHEFRHIQTGQSHDGFCGDFSGWEKQRLNFDEDGYLGCH